MTMQNLQEAFQAAAARLEDDIRKIDAGELEATPEHRAFLAGAVNAWTRPASTETGGYPVDPASSSGPHGAHARSDKGLSTDEPENLDLADTRLSVFDGGAPTAFS